jgi:hypothetical protein
MTLFIQCRKHKAVRVVPSVYTRAAQVSSDGTALLPDLIPIFPSQLTMILVTYVMLYAIEATMVQVANLVTDKLSSYTKFKPSISSRS